MHQDLVRLEESLATALAGLNARQTQATLTHYPNKWSIQQIIEHLLLTWRSTSEAFEVRLRKGTPTKARPNLVQHLGRLLVLNLGVYPRGYSAPQAVYPSLPASLRTGAELEERIHAELLRLDTLLVRGETVLGSGPAVTHLVLGPLAVPQWARFHLVHGLHHGRQIKAIRRDQQI